MKRTIFACVFALFFPLTTSKLEANFAYVVNNGSTNVSVIETSSNTVVATVTIGMAPVAVATTPNGKFAYVTNDNDKVSVIETSSNTVIATVTVGLLPFGIAITPSGEFVYVANSGSTNVSVINTSSNTVVATVTVGTAPSGVAVTPNGEFAYVANSMSTNVSVIDTNSNTVVATVTVGTFSAGVAITPSGEFAYVANQGQNNVSVIDTSSNTVVATVTVGLQPSGIAITSVSSPTPVSSPQNLTAKQGKNDFGFIYEVFNQLKWSPGLSQISGYAVYRNGIQIAILSASTFEYVDHGQKDSVSTTYSVVSIDSTGNRSSPTIVTVK
jgi:YVTN family beta-propeller protein